MKSLLRSTRAVMTNSFIISSLLHFFGVHSFYQHLRQRCSPPHKKQCLELSLEKQPLPLINAAAGNRKARQAWARECASWLMDDWLEHVDAPAAWWMIDLSMWMRKLTDGWLTWARGCASGLMDDWLEYVDAQAGWWMIDLSTWMRMQKKKSFWFSMQTIRQGNERV